jgi:hypothetical protein
LGYASALNCDYLRASILNGSVAQLVEQWTENPCVGGSKPPRTTAK